MSDEPLEKDKNSAEQNLTLQFKKLGDKTTTPPEELKEEVFNSLDSLTLLGDFMDLFTSKFAATNMKIVEAISDEEKEEK